MDGKVNFKSQLSKISTDVDDIEKCFDKVNLEALSKNVELERYPSKGSIQSLPQILTYKNCFNDRKKKKGFMKKSKSEVFYSMSRFDSTTERNEFRNKMVSEQSLQKTNQSVETIGNKNEVVDVDNTIVYDSTISYYYNRLKNKIVSSIKKSRGTKINKTTINKQEIANKMESLFVDPLDTEKNTKEDNNDQLLQHSFHEDTLKKRPHGEITIISNKIFYYRNGVYIDEHKNEFQMSHSKTTTTSERNKQSEIEKIIAPEIGYVPIRKDSLKPQETVSTLLEFVADRSSQLKCSKTTSNSGTPDVRSSSLNLSSTDNGTTQPEIGSSSTTSNSLFKNILRQSICDGDSEYANDSNVDVDVDVDALTQVIAYATTTTASCLNKVTTEVSKSSAKSFDSSTSFHPASSLSIL